MCVVMRSRCYRVSDLIGIMRLLKSEQDEERDGDSDEDYSTPFNSGFHQFHSVLCSRIDHSHIHIIFIAIRHCDSH